MANAEISKAVLGQTLTTEIGERGSYAAAQAHNEVREHLAAADRPIVRGAICQNGADVIQGSAPWFEGTLHFWDWRGGEPPRWDGLGSRWKLYYVPAGEDPPDALRW